MSGPDESLAPDSERALASEMLLQSTRIAFERRCVARRADPVAVLAEALGPGRDPLLFWDLVRAEIEAGVIQLLFAAHPPRPDLDGIVALLNSEAPPAAGSPRFALTTTPTMLDPLLEIPEQMPLWDERSFFEKMTSARTVEEAAVANAILAWARDRGLGIRWGGTEVDGSFTPWLEPGSECYAPITVWSSGRIEVHLDELRATSLFSQEDALRGLRDRVGRIMHGDASLPATHQDTGLTLSDLATRQGMLERFIATLDWIVDLILARE